jgi:hypothetical protein
MQTSSLSLRLPLSFILLGLGSACGQANNASTADSPQADGGEGPVLDTPAKKAPKTPDAMYLTQGGNTVDAVTSPSAEQNANGGSAGEPAAAPKNDTTAPRIVSLEPKNGAVGVSADAHIIIEFSEPMNQRATVDAFASQSLVRPELDMTWNDAGTILTIAPRAALDYAHTTLSGAQPLELEAQAYRYTLNRFASDLAGNSIEETSVKFATLREVTHTLTPVPSLTGVVSSGAVDSKSYAFLSFDFAQLPVDIHTLRWAVVRSGHYVVGEPLPVFDVAFDELSPAAITAGPGTLITTLTKGMTGDQLVPESVWPFLAWDYQHGTATHRYSQFRVELPTSDLATRQAVAELLAQTSVELDYLLP